MKMWVPFALLLLTTGALCSPVTRFTNIKCEVLDPSYCEYKQCHLNVLGRGIIGLNIHAKLLKGPFNNAKINLSLWRKYNGFRPFMFNKTFDFCKFMNKPADKLTIEKMFFDALADSSNINHSCPYHNEIRVKDMVFKEQYLKFLPVPSGEYQFQFIAATDHQWKTKIYATFLRQEDLMSS